MRNFIGNVVLESKNGEADPGGAPPPATPTPTPSADLKSPEQQPPATPTPAPKGEGDKFDEFGYEKDPKAVEPKAGDPPKEGNDPSKDSDPKIEDIKDPKTGYGAEPPKVDEPKPDDPPKDPPKPAEGIEKDLEGLPSKVVERTKSEIEKLKLTPEQQKDYVEMKKSQFAEGKAWGEQQQLAQENANKQQRATWFKELKDDKDFGGEKFQSNVAKAEKTLDEVFPETKKALTAAGTMLPPWIMRDLAALANRLHPKEALVVGQPPAAPDAKDKEDPDAHLKFYS